MVEDFDRIERVVDEQIVSILDHHNLNDSIVNPTVENIALWIWKRLAGKLRGLDELVLWETPTACAILRRGDIVAG